MLRKFMSGIAAGLMALSVVAAGAPLQPAAAAAGHIKIGVLTGQAGGEIGLLITSGEKIHCSFVPDKHEPEHYHGKIRKFGLDVGITAASVIIWAVLAVEGTQYNPGALAGEYAGATAEATAALGLGANLLMGGGSDGFVLQPLSVQGQAGLNLAVGVSVLHLEPGS